MREGTEYLVFSVSARKYALPTRAVREIIRLPALTQEVEAPGSVAGLANIRGHLVPVVDLEIRLGQDARPYQASDSVVIIEHMGLPFGIIVHDVEDVMTLQEDTMSAVPTYTSLDGRARIVTSIANSGDDLTTLLDLGRKMAGDDDLAATNKAVLLARIVTNIAKAGADLIMLLDVGRMMADDPSATSETAIVARKARWAKVKPEDLATLKERAQALIIATDTEEAIGGTQLAIVAIGGERFGIDLALVREFTDVREIVPLPCTPSHMAGLMSLRGDTLTLFDVRVALQMPPRTKGMSEAKAVVVQVDNATHGVLVDDVLDVVYVHADDVVGVPVAGRATGSAHVRGSLRRGDHIITIMDLEAILRDETFTIDEEV